MEEYKTVILPLRLINNSNLGAVGFDTFIFSEKSQWTIASSRVRATVIREFINNLENED